MTLGRDQRIPHDDLPQPSLHHLRVQAGQVLPDQPVEPMQMTVELDRQLLEHRPVCLGRSGVASLQMAAQAGESVVQLDRKGDLVLRTLVPDLVELGLDGAEVTGEP